MPSLYNRRLITLFGLFIAIYVIQSQSVQSSTDAPLILGNFSTEIPGLKILLPTNLTEKRSQLSSKTNVTIFGTTSGGVTKSGIVQSRIIILNPKPGFQATFVATITFISWCMQTYEYVTLLVSVLARNEPEKRRNYRDAAEEINRIEGILDQMTLNSIHEQVYIRDNVAPYEEQIRRCATNAIEYLESPNSTVAKEEFLSGAKSLENSIVRIFERFLNQSVSGPSYLDSLRQATQCHRRQVVNSAQGIMQLLSLGIGTLPLYFKESNMSLADQNRKKSRLGKYQQEAVVKINALESECIKENRLRNEIKEMMKQNNATSNRDLAEIIYDHLSDKYDTKHWFVVVYGAIADDENHRVAFHPGSNNCQWMGHEGNKNAIICSENSVCPWGQIAIEVTKDKISGYFNNYFPRPSVAFDEMNSLKVVPETNMMAVIPQSAKAEIVNSKEMCFFAHNPGNQIIVPWGLTTLGMPLKINTKPTYFAIQAYGKIMQASQYEIIVVDPTWNAGKVKPNDNQLWYLDENGIRAKITGYCLYSSDGRFRTEPCDKQKWMLRDRKITDMYNPKNCAAIPNWSSPTRSPATFPVIESACGNHANQAWSIVKEPTYFAIKSKMHGKVIDISNDPTNYGTIRMWEPMNTSIQLWFQDENKFIRAKFTGYCLYSKGYYAGGFITLPCDQTQNQKWARRNNQIANLNQPSNCMDIFHAEKQDGARVVEYTCSSTINMQWEFDIAW